MQEAGTPIWTRNWLQAGIVVMRISESFDEDVRNLLMSEAWSAGQLPMYDSVQERISNVVFLVPYQFACMC